MVRLDLRYARQLLAWMDLKIFLRTPRAVVLAKVLTSVLSLHSPRNNASTPNKGPIWLPM